MKMVEKPFGADFSFLHLPLFFLQRTLFIMIPINMSFMSWSICSISNFLWWWLEPLQSCWTWPDSASVAIVPLQPELIHGLSKLLHGFVKVVMWICQSCSMYFSRFAKQNQAEVWPRVQSSLKLLLWTKGVEWVKAVNALCLLCLWQCFLMKQRRVATFLHLVAINSILSLFRSLTRSNWS